MKKGKHPVRKTDSVAVRHENAYEEWRLVLLDEGILSKSGKIDLEVLEKKYPGELDEDQVIWIERMQKGEVFEEGEDVPVVEAEPVGATLASPIEDTEASEPAVEETTDADDEVLAPPPMPGETRETADDDEKSYAVGDTFNIQIDEDGDPEEVTVVKIAKDGIHLSSSLDEDTEYLVDPDELAEMVVS